MSDPLITIPEFDMFSSYEPPKLKELGLVMPKSVDEYDELFRWILSLHESGKIDEWEEMMHVYSKHDLYFLLNYMLSDGYKMHNEYERPLYRHEVYRRYCMRTQWQLDNFVSSIDISARSFSKSSIRTKAAAIQLMIRYPEIAMAIVSGERQLAYKQMGVVVEEIDTNRILRSVHNEVFYWDAKEAAKNGECVWSRQDGIRVKRKLPRMNQTLENHAFVGSAPVGSRFDVAFQEDVESEKFVATKDLTEKLHDSVAAFGPLMTPVAVPMAMVFTNNTLYSSLGVVKKKYDELKEKGPEYACLYPAEHGELVNEKFVPFEDGECPGGGKANYPFTIRNLHALYESMGSSRIKYFTQMLGDVTGGLDSTFKREAIIFSDEPWDKLAKDTNAYVCIDASRGLQDPTGVWVWGAASDKRLRLIGGLRKKMDPASPAFHDAIYNIVTTFDSICNRVIEVRVEQFASQTWADLIRTHLQKRGCHIPVVPIRNKGAERTGQFRTSKMERIWSRWSPALQSGKVVFPKPVSMGGEDIMVSDDKGLPLALIEHFLKYEFDAFPAPKHDDLLDASSLIWDADANPIIYPPLAYKKASTSTYFQRMGKATSWMSAG